MKLDSTSDGRKSMWIGRPRFALATGRPLPHCHQSVKANCRRYARKSSSTHWYAAFKCSADSLEIGGAVSAISAEPTLGLTRMSQKGQIEHCGMRIVEQRPLRSKRLGRAF